MTVSKQKKIKILIADDHAVVRQGLIHIISKTSDLMVVDEAQSGSEVLNKINEKEVDVLLMDIEMPGKNGVDLVLEAKQMKPKISILILSIFPEENFAIRYIKAGASGYLNKASATDDLVTAIRKISHDGGKYISSGLAEKMILNWEKDQTHPLHEVLTDREFQIFCKLASGKSPKEIGAELSISVTTVSTHRAHILQKMDLKNNAEITLYAYKNQLIRGTI